MAFFTALAAVAAVGGALSAHSQQQKAEARARSEAKKAETKAKEAAALRAPKTQDVRTKIGVGDAGAGSTTGTERGTSTRQSGTGLGGMEVSAAKIGGL